MESCAREFYAKGFCAAHYQRLKSGKSLLDVIETKDPSRGCKVPSCESPHKCYGFCQKHYSRAPEFKLTQKKHCRTLSARFQVATRRAKKRGLEFNLSSENFTHLANMLCFYCWGKTPETSVGLDRLDNKQGYTPTNVVPCCARCNTIKGEHLTSEQMYLVARTLGFRTVAA